MDMATKILTLRGILDSDDKDETLTAYLTAAAELILNIMYPTEHDRSGLEVPDRYAMNQINIAAYMLNKRGAEGEIQHIELGTHRNYGSSDVPEAMIRHITPFCGVVK